MWKEDFELQEKCRFVKKSGARPRNGGTIMSYYYCNRSGAYVSQGKGIKQGKRKGSAKSNNYCTASITCEELPDGRVDVKVCSTHYGHDTDLQHLRLSRSEKFRIAEQLSHGVPRELVLDNVRASAGPKVERIHLITMKDIKNIEKAFGIQSMSNAKETQGGQDMFSNLHLWVSNMMQLQNSPVLFFQEEGNSNTLSHDVTLILLTKGQMEVLQKYGNNGTYFVSTTVIANAQTTLNNQKFKPKNLYITTVMVVDEVNESFPVSFMVSNQDYDTKYELLFESLKKRVPTISAKIVLTDCREDIYMRWCEVFQEVPNHFWSNRFIDGDWRENLISIADEDLQVSIYERLYSFLESDNSNMLLTSLSEYISALHQNPLTMKFTDHFAKRYMGLEKYWAGCFGKLEVPVSAQLNMEVFCNHLLELCEKKYWDKNFVVKTIQNLLKLANDKQCDRQSKLDRQTHEMSLHHDLGFAIKPEYVMKETESSWRVESFKDPKNIFSIVSQQRPVCGEPSRCVLLCSKCNACTHQMQCSCRVYTYDHTMCKHMHAVALYYFPQVSVTEADSHSDDESEMTHKRTIPKKCLKKEPTIKVRKDLVRNSKRKMKEKQSTGVRGVLPVIEEILSNKHMTKYRSKTKREISLKKKCLGTEDENDNHEKSDSTRQLRKRNSPPKNNQEIVDDESDEEESLSTRIQRKRRRRNSEKGTETIPESNSEPLRKVNILRKVIKKPSKLSL